MNQRAKARKTKSRYRSTTEERFAEHLALQLAANEIKGWLYEPLRFNLGGGAWYKPDFRATELDGTWTFFEVKGFWREAARLRIKIAAAAHPDVRFVGVRLIKGVWEFEDFGPDDLEEREDTNGTD